MPAYRTDQLCTPPQGSSALKPMRSRRKRTVTPWSRIASGPHHAASPHERRIQSSNVNTLEGGHQRVTEDLENKEQIYELSTALRHAKEELATLKQRRDEVTRDCEMLGDQLLDQQTQLVAAIAERDRLALGRLLTN
ncbi:hypothetical protein C0989_003004 [Termitomyces sp. Mn162]|nr:hypothetical protein C0989_003004 [Termitomyces sp. Mn162]